MQRNIESIPLTLIKLDQENVRFGGDVAQTQREAIQLMMADPEDAKKLVKLAEHIAPHGLDPTELQLVMPGDDGSYIVLEGNRRLTALKLLQQPDLCPDPKLVKRFSEAKAKVNSFPHEIKCSVVPSRDAGNMWIELKHTGLNGGVGRLNWDSDIRDERRGRQTGVVSIGRQIRELVKAHPQFFSEQTIADIYEIPVTTLTRLFSSLPAQDFFQLGIKKGVLEPLLELGYIAPAVGFAIDLFKNEGYNVNDIRSDEDRKKFVKHIPLELLPTQLASLRQISPEGVSVSNYEHPDNKLAAHPEHQFTGADQVSVDDPAEPKPSDGKIRAKPSSKARKYLVPWSLKIGNARINEIYKELRSLLLVDAVPNATAIAFRVFIEVTCDSFVSQQRVLGTAVLRHDNRKELREDDKLMVKVQSVVKHLEDQNKISRHSSKALHKRAGSFDVVGSIDHFNMFVHGSASSPLPSELKDIAEDYRPMLEAIWS